SGHLRRCSGRVGRTSRTSPTRVMRPRPRGDMMGRNGGTVMSTRINRRHFLHASAAGGAALGLGLGDVSFLSRLPRVSAAEAKLDTKLVRLDPDIEPTVRLLEDTPRE